MSSLEGMPGDAAKSRFVRRRAYAAFQAHGYVEVRPPAIEPVGVAALTGSVALRVLHDAELRSDPMVSIARQFAAAGAAERFARWMLVGDAFDPEPAGALRTTVWQAVAGVIFGSAEPAADAELVSLAHNLSGDLGLAGAEVVLGTSGDAGDLERYAAATAGLLRQRCGVCAAARDPLRFLTCEDPSCRALAESAPPIRDSLGVAALRHHESVLATLDASGFVIKDDPRLAFGGGRYARTVMELRARTPAGDLVTVARGGRRDHLLASAGGRPLPAVGLTIGIDRAVACTPGDGASYQAACEVFIAARGTAGRAFALRAAAAERSRGFRVDVDLRADRDAGWADQLRRAEAVRARVVVVVGDVERKRGEVAIRDMQTRETRQIPEETLPAELKRLLR